MNRELVWMSALLVKVCNCSMGTLIPIPMRDPFHELQVRLPAAPHSGMSNITKEVRQPQVMAVHSPVRIPGVWPGMHLEGSLPGRLMPRIVLVGTSGCTH